MPGRIHNVNVFIGPTAVILNRGTNRPFTIISSPWARLVLRHCVSQWFSKMALPPIFTRAQLAGTVIRMDTSSPYGRLVNVAMVTLTHWRGVGANQARRRGVPFSFTVVLPLVNGANFTKGERQTVSAGSR